MEVLFDSRPPLPLPVRAMNRFERLGRLLVGLDAEGLLAAARRRSRLDDYGDESFREGLERLVESLQRDARLTTLGRITARFGILQALENRLAVVDHLKRHPAVATEEVRRPLFIIGLPRTGTTILQELLAQDPANRPLRSWEALAPCPPPDPATCGADPRIGRIQKQFDQLYRLVPGFAAAHEMSAAAPQECVVLFNLEFMSEQFTVQFDVRDYQAWLDDQAMTRAYATHRCVLQLLQSGGVRGERWLLKSPAHVSCIDELLAAYPDAAVIHTHRDPVTVVLSLASLMCMLRGISSDAVEPRAVARQQLDWWEKLLMRCVEQRRRYEGRSSQFYDLHLKQIIDDPLGVVERIYGHFGFDLTPAARARMEAFMRRKPRDRHGVHTYRPADFGIDPAAEARRFSAYTEYFHLQEARHVG